jgi:hypothetical protein
MSRCAVFLALAASGNLLTGCGSSAPVMAQTAYTSASLDGSYGISFNSTGGGADLVAPNGAESAYGALGNLKFDGAGNVSGGNITVITSTGKCVVSVTGGTYSVQATGLGTISVTPVVTSGGCLVSASWRADLAVAQQGASFNFASNPGTAGSGAKQ